MSAVRGLIRSAVVVKLVDVVRREAAKPENQEKARRVARQVADRIDRELDRRRASKSAR